MNETRDPAPEHGPAPTTGLAIPTDRKSVG